jgi:hypothetical protein
MDDREVMVGGNGARERANERFETVSGACMCTYSTCTYAMDAGTLCDVVKIKLSAPFCKAVGAAVF